MFMFNVTHCLTLEAKRKQVKRSKSQDGEWSEGDILTHDPAGCLATGSKIVDGPVHTCERT